MTDTIEPVGSVPWGSKTVTVHLEQGPDGWRYNIKGEPILHPGPLQDGLPKPEAEQQAKRFIQRNHGHVYN